MIFAFRMKRGLGIWAYTKLEIIIKENNSFCRKKGCFQNFLAQAVNSVSLKAPLGWVKRIGDDAYKLAETPFSSMRT